MSQNLKIKKKYGSIVSVLWLIRVIPSAMVSVLFLVPLRSVLISDYIYGWLAVLLMTAGTFVFNDIRDVAIDKINCDYRPIPSGAITLRFAWWIFTTLILLAIIFAWLVNWRLCLILATYSGVLLWYSYSWKKWWTIKNIGIAFTYSSVITFPYLSGIVSESFFVFFIVCFLLILSREIRMDLKDLKGDKSSDLHTMASRLGIKKSNVICGVLLLSAISLFISTSQDHMNFFVQTLLLSTYGLVILLSFTNLLTSQKQLFVLAESEKYLMFFCLISIW